MVAKSAVDTRKAESKKAKLDFKAAKKAGTDAAAAKQQWKDSKAAVDAAKNDVDVAIAAEDAARLKASQASGDVGESKDVRSSERDSETPSADPQVTAARTKVAALTARCELLAAELELTKARAANEHGMKLDLAPYEAQVEAAKNGTSTIMPINPNPASIPPSP